MGALGYSSAPDRSRAVTLLPSEKFATARKSPGTEVGLVFPLPPSHPRCFRWKRSSLMLPLTLHSRCFPGSAEPPPLTKTTTTGTESSAPLRCYTLLPRANPELVFQRTNSNAFEITITKLEALLSNRFVEILRNPLIWRILVGRCTRFS